MIIPLDKRTVNIKDIWVEVQCLYCKSIMNIQMKRSQFQKNCHCGNCTFHITVTALRGSKVAVNVMAQEGFSQAVNIEIIRYSIDS